MFLHRHTVCVCIHNYWKCGYLDGCSFAWFWKAVATSFCCLGAFLMVIFWLTRTRHYQGWWNWLNWYIFKGNSITFFLVNVTRSLCIPLPRCQRRKGMSPFQQVLYWNGKWRLFFQIDSTLLWRVKQCTRKTIIYLDFKFGRKLLQIFSKNSP